MSWIIYGFLNALFRSFTDVAGKIGLKNMDEYIVAWSLTLFSLPFLYIQLPFTDIPEIGDKFWIAILFGGGTNLLTAIFYMKAIKLSDLSVTIPMVSFTPLFLLLTSPLILGEFPKTIGLLGVLLIVFGSYFLNLKSRKKGILAPFKALISEKGPRYMLLVAFLWSIGANMDKMGIQNSSPIFWVISVNTAISIGMIPIILIKSRSSIKQMPAQLKILIPIGFFHAVSLTFQMIAYTMTLVTYVISIKRTSILMSVVFGALIFKEKGIKERLIGAIIMVLGAILITFS